MGGRLGDNGCEANPGLLVNDLSMGIPGVGEIHPGTHICALYSGQAERDRLLLPFMQEGLRHGDRCVSLVDGLEPVSMRLQAYETPEHTHAPVTEHLGLHAAHDSFVGAEDFSLTQTLSSLAAERASSTDTHFPVLRAVGEMSGLPQELGAQEVLVYESAVIEVLAELPAVILCLYDVHRFGAGMLVSILKVHSTVLVEGAVLHNSQGLAPTASPTLTPEPVARYPLARIRAGGVDAGQEWLSLTGTEVRVAELVASGMTNRATAEELLVSHHTVDAHLKHIYVKLGIHSRVELTVLALQQRSAAG